MALVASQRTKPHRDRGKAPPRHALEAAQGLPSHEMVLGRALRLAASSTAGASQRDPLPGAKALMGLALLFGLFRLLPEDLTNTWLA